MEVISLIVGTIIVLALLGIIIAFSPTLILTEIAILTRSKRPFFHTLFLILGIATSVIIFSIITWLFIDPAKEISIPSTREVFALIPVMDILVGILLVITGLRLLRPTTKQLSAETSQPDRMMSPKALYFFGLIKMSTSLSSIAAIIFASRFIKTNYTFDSAQFMALLWLICISLLPFMMLIGAKLYRPQMFSKIQHASDRVSTLDWRRLLAGAILIASIWFLVIGLRNL